MSSFLSPSIWPTMCNVSRFPSLSIPLKSVTCPVFHPSYYVKFPISHSATNFATCLVSHLPFSHQFCNMSSFTFPIQPPILVIFQFFHLPFSHQFCNMSSFRSPIQPPILQHVKFHISHSATNLQHVKFSISLSATNFATCQVFHLSFSHQLVIFQVFHLTFNHQCMGECEMDYSWIQDFEDDFLQKVILKMLN